MKHILLCISILMLSACGSGGSGGSASSSGISELPNNTENFVLQNIRFDSTDYYEGESITITEGTDFEVQWVSPTSASYKIDLYLSSNDEEHSDNNKIVGLKCGGTSFSLCPNATGEVQCLIDDNTLSCSVGSDYLGNENFQDADLSSLDFIIKGCDVLSNCDVKTFSLLIQNNTED